MNEDFLPEQVCKCFIRVTNIGTIYGEVLPNIFLVAQTIKVKVRPFSNNITQNQQNCTKRLMQPVDFRQIFQFTCDCGQKLLAVELNQCTH